MPEPVNVAALLDSAGTNMDAAALLLMRGDTHSVDESQRFLQRAIDDLSGVSSAPLDEQWHSGMTLLHQKSRSLDRFLRETDRFHTGSYQALERLSGAYSSQGQMMTRLPAGTISVVL